MTGPVTVRWAHLDDLSDAALATVPLTGGEQDRVRALRRDPDRRLFVGARYLLRAAVGEVTGTDPDQVVLHQRCSRCDGPHGRPTVQVGSGPGPHVSIAHAGCLAVVAASADPVGVDVEPCPPADRDGAPTDRLDRRTWVRREAVLKALGLGVDVEPDPVHLGPADATPKLVGWSGPGRRPRIHLTDLDTDPGHLVTVAGVGRRRPVDVGRLGRRDLRVR